MNNQVVVDQNLTQLLKVDEESGRQLLKVSVKGHWKKRFSFYQNC